MTLNGIFPENELEDINVCNNKNETEVPKRNLSRTAAGILNLMFMNVCISLCSG